MIRPLIDRIRNDIPTIRTLFLLGIGTVLLGLIAIPAAAEWTQWGGDARDFKTGPQELATTWPEDGPRELWRRPLGHGNSTIVADGGVLYTMYRDGDNEFTVALDEATGKTLWSHKEGAPLWEGFADNYGSGPHTTPILHGDRLYTAGIAAKVMCLDKATGTLIWSRDLWKDYDAKPLGRGYASSPLIHGDTLIVLAGGKNGHSVVALDLKNGELKWASHDFKATFSSPILIEAGGRQQVVAFMGEEVIGFDPADGQLLWKHGHQTKYNVNAMTPVWGYDDILFVSSAYDAGSRALRLAGSDGKMSAEELWYNRSMKVHHATVVRLGKLVVGSSGDFGPAFVMGMDAETGEVRFKERGFAKANIIASGTTLILLDEDGKLGLATVEDDGFKVHAEAQIFKSRAWSAPTLVGTTLYARDWQEIVALDLGSSGGQEKSKAAEQTTSP